MSRPNFDRLVAPPRTVPLSLRVNALFGGMAAFAWGVLLFTTPIFWGFAMNAEVLAPIVFGASAATTDGRVTATGETSSSEDETRIHWVDYSYQVPASPLLSGRSYVTGGAPGVGAELTVEYVPSWPHFSRIVGMRKARFGPGAAVAVVFPALAAVFVAFSLHAGRRTLRLLREGRVAEATFVSQQPTNTTINGRVVQELTFEYDTPDRGRRRFATSTTDPGNLRDERRETILYLPEEPDTATAVDALPMAVVIDEGGELASGPAFQRLMRPAVPWRSLQTGVPPGAGLRSQSCCDGENSWRSAPIGCRAAPCYDRRPGQPDIDQGLWPSTVRCW